MHAPTDVTVAVVLLAWIVPVEGAALAVAMHLAEAMSLVLTDLRLAGAKGAAKGTPATAAKHICCGSRRCSQSRGLLCWRGLVSAG